MVTRYATPEAFRQALEQRLRNEAAAVGYGITRLRQLLVFDRFLARITQVYGDAAVLKGGIVLELRLERARTTKDIDLRLSGRPDETLAHLPRAGRLNLGDHLAFEVRFDPHHPDIRNEGMRYEGFRFRVAGRLAGRPYGSPFGLDVAFGQPMTGEAETLLCPDRLGFAGIAPPALRVYPIETHIAEKLHAYTQPRTHPNSRVKDLPDLALLGTIRPLHSARLRAAIHATFEHRGTHPVPRAFPPPPEAWAPVYARMASMDRLPWLSVGEAAAVVVTLLDPVLAGAPVGTWSPGSWRWLPDSGAT